MFRVVDPEPIARYTTSRSARNIIGVIQLLQLNRDEHDHPELRKPDTGSTDSAARPYCQTHIVNSSLIVTRRRYMVNVC